MSGTGSGRYIASGFEEDASKLLNEFIDRSTAEFSDFAEIWRKQSFSLIFMGRPDYTETCEFVNEIFRKSAHFLSSPSFYQQVGAVYLLYGLFRNQISEPIIKIRIEINQWRIIKSLLIEAKLKNYQTLEYVIHYLRENAFIFVAHQTTKGPLIGCLQKSTKQLETITTLKATYKSDLLNYSVSNNLEKLRDINAQYQEMKQLVKDKADIPAAAGNSIYYEEFIKGLKGLVEPPARRIYKNTEDVGSRRAKIKANAFIIKSRDRFGNTADDPDEIESDSDANLTPSRKKKKAQKPKRKPVDERKLGRPSCKIEMPSPPPPKSDDEIDISHLVPQQQDFYLPPEENESRKIRTRRNPYYKVIKKEEDDDDDSSIDMPSKTGY